MKKTVLVTGVAGFIGFHLARRLLKEGHHVIGIDVVNDYYDLRLKESRLHVLTHPRFKLYRDALENKMAITRVFEKKRTSSRGQFGGSGRCTLQLRKSGCLCSIQHRWFLEHLGGLSFLSSRTIDLCLIELGLRIESGDAIF